MDKYNLSDIFNDLNSESSVILPKSIKIKNIKDIDTISNTTSSFMPQKGGNSDATSSFMPQKGGYSDATSSFIPQKGGYLNGTKNKDINQLISMLSDTSYDNYTTNSTDTEQLKKKLLNIVQDGGSEKGLFEGLFEGLSEWVTNIGKPPQVILSDEVKKKMLKIEKKRKNDDDFEETTFKGIHIDDKFRQTPYYKASKEFYYAGNEEKIIICDKIIKDTKDEMNSNAMNADVGNEIIKNAETLQEHARQNLYLNGY